MPNELQTPETLRARAGFALAERDRLKRERDQRRRRDAEENLRDGFIREGQRILETVVDPDEVVVFNDEEGYPHYAAAPVGLGPDLFFSYGWRTDYDGFALVAGCPVCKERVRLSFADLEELGELLLDLKGQTARSCGACARKEAARDDQRAHERAVLKPPPSPAEELAAAIRRLVVAEVVALREEGL